MRLPVLVLASQVAQLLRIHLQCRRCGFNPWVGKIPWRRAWQPTPVFLPGESHGQRSLVGLQSMGSQRVGHDWATERTSTLMFCKALSGGPGKPDLGVPHREDVCHSLWVHTARDCFPVLSWPRVLAACRFTTCGSLGQGSRESILSLVGASAFPRSLLRASFAVTARP